MKAELSAWLIASAEKLRAGVKDELDIVKLLDGFGIRMVSESNVNRSGALARDGDGNWLVIVRGQRRGKNLTTADRFTAAHELGHYLLQKNWAFSPSFTDKKNYYDCEELCNQFAARLLVDHGKIAESKILSPQMCLGLIRACAEKYSVSLEVATRSILETHSGIGVCAFVKSADGYSRLWGLSSLNGISPRFPKKRLISKSVQEEVCIWGRKLLDKQKTGERLVFATESAGTPRPTNKLSNKVELSAVMKKPPADV